MFLEIAISIQLSAVSVQWLELTQNSLATWRKALLKTPSLPTYPTNADKLMLTKQRDRTQFSNPCLTRKS
ncbi:hypothetical protein H6F76_21525 [Leptolyngbya sp. FACHB-321]|uniref:hypothetical protein n=1 Tax=Leptolyngbya sp. FACHB-321 TaxID=2692807 RepID=UPI00168831D2|nr:hypothetical protein [Leptolyngbya sp. FACHB-321]MBD2037547.1 hypothetical protein [Leptolyngbya sp. FACHB-321]